MGRAHRHRLIGLPVVMSTRPAPLSLAALAALTERVAGEVRAGLHTVHADADERWHVRLRCSDDVDVWLISWTTDQGTQLHDHGGSSGSFTVVEGQLAEAIWADGGGTLSHHARSAGDSVVFGEKYVHDVRNVGTRTAVSVHAYSPPLTAMSYYDVEGDQLVRLATAWTDDPEHEPAEITRRRAS